MDLQEELLSFARDVYPSAEETKNINKTILYKRKKAFLEDLRGMFNGMGYVLICFLYLRDISIIRFAIRMIQQFNLSNPFPIIGSSTMMSDDNKRAVTKFLLISVLLSNGFCIIVHLVWGAYKISPQWASANLGHASGSWSALFDGSSESTRITDETVGYFEPANLAITPNLLYGGVIIQFIGERVPFSRFELILFDFAITVVQLVYHSLTCVLSSSDILSSSADSQEVQEDGDITRISEDGYSGNVELLDVDVVANICKVWRYQAKFQMPEMNPFFTQQGQTPGPQPGILPVRQVNLGLLTGMAGNQTAQGNAAAARAEMAAENAAVENVSVENTRITIPGAFPED